MRKQPTSYAVNSGYSLLELTAVVSVMSILLVVTIPPAVKQFIILPKADEAKTLLNSVIAQCLQDQRSNPNDGQISPSSTLISNERLNQLSYKINTDSKSCANFELIPSEENETILFPLGFRISAGKVLKYASPARDKVSLSSCQAWAGANCTASQQQIEYWRGIEDLENQKKACNDSFYTFLNSGSKGQKNVWDDVTNSCSRTQWVLDGTRYTSKDAYDAAFVAKVGKECAATLASYAKNNPPNGPYKNEACDINTYFLNGTNLESSDPAVYQAKQKEYNDLQCDATEQAWLKDGMSGAFTWPTGLSCSAKWKCPRENNKIYLDLSSYNTSSCAAPPPAPAPPPEPPCRIRSSNGICILR